VGAGAQPIYNLLTGSNMTFASIPFAGVPEITSLLVFATTDPPLDVVGLSLLQPGDYPLSGSVDYASLGDVVGDLELILPDIVVPPQTVMLSGTLRVLGDVDADDLVEYEVRDLTASLALQFPGLIGGENVDVDVVSTLTANLSGEAAAPILVPLLGGAGLWLLAGGLTLVGGRCAGRMRPQAR
jgi:hypothetical protein